MTDPVSEPIDLHLHSTLSDGLLAPSEVIERLAAAKISIACFTDHNCVHPLHPTLKAYAQDRHGVLIAFPSAEVTVAYRDPSGRDRAYILHVLAYGDGVMDPRFLRWLDQPNGPRREYLRGVHESLVSDGFRLPPFEEIFRTHDADPALDCAQLMCTRAPLANALGQVLGIPAAEARERFIPRQPPASSELGRLDVFDLLEWGRRLGIALIAAHPGRVRDCSAGGNGGFEDLLEVIAELAGLGLDGVEAQHRLNTDAQIAALRELAEGMDLITTGGSDFHGRPECVLGTHATSRLQYERLCGRIAEKTCRAGPPLGES